MIFTEEPVITVGILTSKKIKFELHGNFKLAKLKNALSGRFVAEIKNNNIEINGNKTQKEFIDEIIFEPEDAYSDLFVIKNVTIGVDFHWQREETQQFNHSLKLIRDNDELIAINRLPVEDYLISVISSEMSAKCSPQLLKAHAVVSRSWILAQLDNAINTGDIEPETTTNNLDEELIRWYNREQHKYFDVCGDDHCQRFQGITKISTEITRKAVSDTRGVVLMNDNNICDTRYSKSCGGITEDYKNVWNQVDLAYLTSVVDYKHVPDDFDLDLTSEVNARRWIQGNPPSYCNAEDEKILSQILVDFDQETKDFFRWEREYSQRELSSIIKEKSGFDFGDIIDLVPLERGRSARLIKLRIVGTKKTLIIGKELEIRRILSPTHLYSSAFVIEKVFNGSDIPVKFILYGAGWGHGVGLCQIGSAVMAETGYKFDEILMHYFSNAKIKKIY